MLALPGKAPEMRPAAVGSIDSDTHPVRCHWERNEHAALCDEVLAGIEEAWDVQVGTLGWPAPIPDADGILDAYVSSDGGGGAYAYGPWDDAIADDGRIGTHAYIVVDPEFETWLRWTMLHEFNHVLQYGIDVTEPRYVPWEGVATAAESWTDPTLPPLDVYISDFQATPWVGLLGDGYQLWDEHEIWSSYEYGSALWWFHLDATTGDGRGSAGLGMWLDGAQDNWTNEPDFVDASARSTGDWVDDWMAFAITRTAVGTSATPAWASTYAAADFEVGFEERLSIEDLPIIVTPAFMPFQTGAVYVELTGLTAEMELEIHIDGDPGVRWAILAADAGEGSWEEGTTLVVQPDSDHLVIGAVNLGPDSFDSDDVLSSAGLQLHISQRAVADAGTEKAGGCGCSARGPDGPRLGLLIFLAGLFYRRRRSNREG
jgi:MYXO-CTERM domain-containing protein